MIEAIESFLKGEQPYQVGCSLFLSITTNKHFALRLMATQSESHEKMLHAELTQYVQSQPGYWERFVSEEVEEVEPQKQKVETSYSFQEKKSVSTGSVKESIETTRKEYYRERGHLHGRLHEAHTDEERYELAKQIMTLRTKIDAINRQLKEINAGDIPVDYLREKLTGEQYKEIQNLKKYIRRTTNELAKETSKSIRAKLEQKLAEYNKKLSKYAQ